MIAALYAPMNKLIIFGLLWILSGCTYQPYRYERYVIDGGDAGQARIKDASSTFSINVSPTRYNPDLAKKPYKIYFNYVDSSKQLNQLAICNIMISTDHGRQLYKSESCKNIDFEVPSLVEGVEPYANSANLAIENIDPDFQAGEKLIINFSYGTDSTKEKITVNLVFKPVLDKGKFQPCCLPSV